MKIDFDKIEVSMVIPEAGPYINTIIWKFPDYESGEYTEPVVLDRTRTDYEFIVEGERSYLKMEWSGVYIWDGEKEVLIPDKFKNGDYVKGALLGIEIDDDAPEGYGIVEWSK